MSTAEKVMWRVSGWHINAKFVTHIKLKLHTTLACLLINV